MRLEDFYPMSTSSDKDVYDVETILRDRVVNGRRQYLIKWLGFSSEHNTWEDEDNILSDELKREYEEGKSTAKRGAPVRFEPRVTNEWAGLIREVVGVSLNDHGKLEVEYVTEDGRKGVCLSDEIHIKAPIKLLNFYEGNITFPE